MNKKRIISFLRSNHLRMEEVLGKLSGEQKLLQIGDWTVKEVLVHLTAWLEEYIPDINSIRKGEKPWHIDNITDDEFNKRAVERAKMTSYDEVLSNWQNAFKKVLELLEEIPDEEWSKDSGHSWDDGSPITIESLFKYRYNDSGHEGGHAEEIEAILGT